jgi:hypothetical protein
MASDDDRIGTGSLCVLNEVHGYGSFRARAADHVFDFGQFAQNNEPHPSGRGSFPLDRS